MNGKTSKLLQSLLRAGGVCGAAATVGVVGITLSGDAEAGISNTKHNLTASNVTSSAKSTGTEICAFCHTPHISNTSIAAPLWNRATDATGYTLYSSPTLETQSAITTLSGSASLACLSCHDGVGSMDTMVNAPGSGFINSAGARPGGGYTWSNASATGVMLASAIGNLSKDMRNDHPVGIPYAGGGYSKNTAPAGGVRVTCVTCVDKDFWEPNRTASVSGWYLDTQGGTTGTRDKTDLTLYPDQTLELVRVECASCHDPHIERPSGATTQMSFMRMQNTASSLCLACHNK